uniref:F-box protein PP2-B11-like n=1 Tax=Rhizophora mucronata TaxID=61149 RepID=A0A2P2J194_RHIMU
MDFLTYVLPEDCLSRIISFTSPVDASRSAAVSRAFESAADSDAVWGSFLPPDYGEIITRAAASFPLLSSLSKKDLYFHLCHNPILLDGDPIVSKVTYRRPHVVYDDRV